MRLSDVYPTGEARLIQDSAVRMRWRNGGTTPQFMEKDVVYPASISLWNTSYVVAPGHALRFSISSSNYPRFSVNGNNGILLADDKYPGNMISAVNSIYHSEEFPTYFELPVVNKVQIPPTRNIRAEFEKAYPQIDYAMVVEKGPQLFDKLTKRMKNGNH